MTRQYRFLFFVLFCVLVGFAFAVSAYEVHQLTDEGNNIHPSLDDGHVTWVRWDAEGSEIMISNLEVAFPAVTSLTDNVGEKEHPSNRGSSRIVWQGRGFEAGDDWEIFVYDKYAIPRSRMFTDNDIPDRYPSLGIGGNFAWQSGDAMFESIHYWNESMKNESVISNPCCPTTSHSNEAPSYDDYEVVWRTNNRIAGGSEFMFWSGFASELDIPFGTDPDLYRGTMAYVGLVSGKRHILYWDGDDVHEVTSGIYEGYNPSLYAGKIAFERWIGGNWEIYYWDGSATHRVTDNDFDDNDPSYDGNTVAWKGRPTGGSDQIYYARVPEPSLPVSTGVALGTLLVLALRRDEPGSRSIEAGERDRLVERRCSESGSGVSSSLRAAPARSAMSGSNQDLE
jgi:hypothetical protein